VEGSPAVHLIYLSCVPLIAADKRIATEVARVKQYIAAKKTSAVHASTLADGVRPRRIVCRRGRKRETLKKAKEKALSSLARAGKIAFIRAPVPFTYLGLEHLLDCGIRLLGTQQI
jgi:hypothetical protein